MFRGLDMVKLLMLEAFDHKTRMPLSLTCPSISAKRRTAICRIGILAVLILLVISTRLYPLSISQYPFNNDAVGECRIASDIIASGHMDFPDDRYYTDSHSVITPAYNILLAFTASVIDVSTFDIAQITIAIASVITVIGAYLIAFRMTGSRCGAISAAMVLSLFGTFVYLTGSGWKEALGVAFMILLLMAYINRSERRMIFLEIAILAMLPLVHHLIAVVAYMGLAYLTGWSVFVALLSRNLHRRHAVDVIILAILSFATLLYYRYRQLDGLDYVDTASGALSMIVSFLVLLGLTTLLFARRKHTSLSFAPIPAIALLCLFIWNHFNPLFPYDRGELSYVLLLGFIMCYLIALAWRGFEISLRENTRYRLIPFGILLPVLTIFLFALMSGFDLDAHKILYRTFDLADISLAFGISVVVASMPERSRRRKFIVAGLIIGLVASFPFGYATGTLVGVRHDTQEYEVNTIEWVYVHAGATSILQSDERLAYNAMVLYDYEKNPGLPLALSEERLPRQNVFNVFLEEWTEVGVSIFPYGYHVLNETFALTALSASNVFYVGGPVSNNIVVFCVSFFGSDTVF